MKIRNAFILNSINSILILNLVIIFFVTSAMVAQEYEEFGRMWTFENPPLTYLQKEYDFNPDQQWLDSLRLGTLRLGGEDIVSSFASASFVSPQGLILASNQSLRFAFAATMNSARSLEADHPAKNLKSGFVANSSENEIRLRSTTSSREWLTAAQLVRMRNVTEEVNWGIQVAHNAFDKKRKRDANKERILDDARKSDRNLVPQIVSLYQGAVFQLYQYKVFDDIRLVCTPDVKVARFGSDDKFAFPSHHMDFAFLRAYENGRPANTANHWFRWKPGGAQPGELVFVSGNPSSTKRLFTQAQLTFERDIKMPIEVEWLTNRSRYWNEQDMLGGEVYAAYAPMLKEGLSAARDNLLRLQDSSLMMQKQTAELSFKNRVLTNEKLADRFGHLWDRIEILVEKRRRHEARLQFHSTVGIGMLEMAITVVRSCDPAETEEYRKQARKEVASWGSGGMSALPTVAFFVDHVARARKRLPKDDPYISKVLGGMTGEDFLKAVQTGGKEGQSSGPGGRALVYWPEHRNALIEAGWEAIQDSTDAAIASAREYVILMRENDKLKADLVALEESLYAELGQALLACYGTEVGADATGTARFSDGVVTSFQSKDSNVRNHTTFADLYARNNSYQNKSPLKLPKTWLDRIATIDLSTPLNFVTSNDITSDHLVIEGNFWRDRGGSSGSVVVNKDLEVVGLVIERAPLSNDFLFRDKQSNAISVHVDGIMETLVKIYNADHIARELMGK